MRTAMLGLCVGAPRVRQRSNIATRGFALGLPIASLRLRTIAEAAATEADTRAAALAVAAERIIAAAARASPAPVTPRLTRSPSVRSPMAGARMRSIHWDALPDAAVRGTIWEGNSTLRAGDSSGGVLESAAGSVPSVDIAQLLPALVAEFAAGPTTAASTASVAAVAAANAATRGAADPVITLLDPKVSKNAAIALRSSLGRTPLASINTALATLDSSVFGATPTEAADHLSILLVQRELFEDNALAAVRAFAGEASRLAQPERFVRDVVLATPAALQRLTAMEFALTLSAITADATARLDGILTCCGEVKRSTRFSTLLLDCLLPLGNHLNANAPTRGFRLSSLARLAQTKNASGRETFLSFCVKVSC